MLSQVLFLCNVLGEAKPVRSWEKRRDALQGRAEFSTPHTMLQRTPMLWSGIQRFCCPWGH